MGSSGLYLIFLNYENIKTHFNDSKSVINNLKRHIENFDKSKKFLSNDTWVKNMCSDGSYSTMYKSLDVLKNLRKRL